MIEMKVGITNTFRHFALVLISHSDSINFNC